MTAEVAEVARFLGALISGIVVGGGGIYKLNQRRESENGNGKKSKSSEPDCLDKPTHALLCENAFLKFNNILETRFDKVEDLIRSLHT